MVFHWSLSDSKSPQVSRTLLSILVVLNNAVVWMVSTRPPNSKSSSPFSNPLVTVPNAPITIVIIVTCMFHSFFNSLSRYLSFFSLSFSFILWSAGTAKSTILQIILLLLLLLLLLLRVFHITFNWWTFTWEWVTSSLHKSQGLFSVFGSFSIMLWCGWFQLNLLFSSPPIPLIILWWLYQKHKSRFL